MICCSINYGQATHVVPPCIFGRVYVSITKDYNTTFSHSVPLYPSMIRGGGVPFWPELYNENPDLWLI